MRVYVVGGVMMCASVVSILFGSAMRTGSDVVLVFALNAIMRNSAKSILVFNMVAVCFDVVSLSHSRVGSFHKKIADCDDVGGMEISKGIEEESMIALWSRSRVMSYACVSAVRCSGIIASCAGVIDTIIGFLSAVGGMASVTTPSWDFAGYPRSIVF